jgi:GTP cyclohydrolase II
MIVDRTGESTVHTRHGAFKMIVFRADTEPEKEHSALVAGDVRGTDVLVRIHSECLTGDTFGSLHCDCGEQLTLAQRRVARAGRGAILYLRQEGRGIGLGNKMRAYKLQADGLDTVDANLALGLPDDARTYDVAVAILRELGIESVRLMTNNPAKIVALERLGIPVVERIGMTVGVNPHNARYLATKRLRARHLIETDPPSEPDLPLLRQA